MDRRDMIRSLLASAAATATAKNAAAQEMVANASRGVPTPKIKDIVVIRTAPTGAHLVVAKIITDQPGLHGFGCGSFTGRADLVAQGIEEYLKPALIGKGTDRIEDIWETDHASGYWRNGPVVNNMTAAIDGALWDIKARQANMPVYQIMGGKAREAADCYQATNGKDIPDTIAKAKGLLAKGFRHVKLGVNAADITHSPEQLVQGATWNRDAYFRDTLKMLEAARQELGDSVGLIHDAHEKLNPTQAVQFAKLLEPVNMFYLEDVLPPEQIGWFRNIRQACTTPLSMGELFVNPNEWLPLISERLIDFMRMHVSEAGGVTNCRKVAALGEAFGVRTAWHGPQDVSPVGHAGNLALSLTSQNFGIQEYSGFSDISKEIFKGAPEFKNGYLYANELPGWGIEVDEALAAKYPYKPPGAGGGGTRMPDGSAIVQ